MKACNLCTVNNKLTKSREKKITGNRSCEVLGHKKHFMTKVSHELQHWCKNNQNKRQ